MSSLQLTTPLILPGDPTQPRHASTKQYVDMVLGHPNAMGFTSGTIPVAKLPALTGVVSSDAGDNVLTLNNSGVTPGTYTKVTVSSSGRITAGTSTGEDDIQSVDWSRITSGKPTTLAGYGITDVLPSTGGTITGSLKLTQPPSDNLHPVTKAYVDNALLTGATTLATGDIIRKPTSVTPSGFLRLNGGLVSKTTYAALYAKLGDVFGDAGSIGGGTPWKNQSYFNETQTTQTLTGFNSSHPSLPIDANSCTVFVTKNVAYVLGGFGGSGFNDKIYYNPIDSSGNISPAGWLLSGVTFPYITGNNIICFAFKNFVYASTEGFMFRTAINPLNGVIGPWEQISVTGIIGLSGARLFVFKNRVYALTGQNKIYSAVINIDGSLEPFVLTQDSDMGYDGRSYPHFVLGNKICSLIDISQTKWIQSATVNPDGSIGVWTLEPVNGISYETSASKVVVTKNRLYLFGASSGGSKGYCSSAPIDQNGKIGNFVIGSRFNKDYYYDVFVTSSKIYAVGGYGPTNSVSRTIESFDFSGGLNDYSPYYNQTNPTPNYFAIPDYSSREGHKLCYYIKT